MTGRQLPPEPPGAQWRRLFRGMAIIGVVAFVLAAFSTDRSNAFVPYLSGAGVLLTVIGLVGLVVSFVASAFRRG